ncbi:hypothetical protein [Streptomyces prunicolor]|uniref:hypothetical protein n=1 Tax=Streptomyces prunicolor TaxID=67348 RepID=UPI0003681F07|nr:hypothetical protein [Streptomyces prunicolor]
MPPPLRPRRVETVATRRRRPLAPQPDPHRIFLEPAYTDPAVAAEYAQAWEEEQAERAIRRRPARRSGP